MSPYATYPSFQATERRQQRTERQRLRELERHAKEYAKYSAQEHARIEVERYENRIELLRSVHKEQGEAWDWLAVAASLPPPQPQKNSYHEQRATQQFSVVPSDKKEAARPVLENARLQDEKDYQTWTLTYKEEIAQWERVKDLAQRILRGEPTAYTKALVEYNPFAEISDLGLSINFTVHNAKFMECALMVNGKSIIPAEVKTLTASGKVAVKPIPKGLFHEIYLDYLCGCVLRVAREIFALLPVDTVLVTAAVDSLDSRTGQTVGQPVLSVAMARG